MARHWEKINDGRECLVIDQEDGTSPMRVYGRTREEILEKLANSVETGQRMIDKMRTTKPAERAATPAPAAAPAKRQAPSPDEVMVAAADITNPARAGQAAKTLLRSIGIDPDKMAARDLAERNATVCRAWNGAHPEFPKDDRSRRLLIDRAILNSGTELSEQSLETAYTELLNEGWKFELEQPAASTETQPTTQETQPGGSPSPSVTRPRMATSYSRNSLNARTPAAQPKDPYTREQIVAMNTREFQEKILSVPEVAAWYNRKFSGAAAVA